MYQYFFIGNVFAIDTSKDVYVTERKHVILESELIEIFKVTELEEYDNQQYTVDGNVYYELSSSQLLEMHSLVTTGNKDYFWNTHVGETVEVFYKNGIIDINSQKIEFKSRAGNKYTKTAKKEQGNYFTQSGSIWTLSTTFYSTNQPMYYEIISCDTSVGPYYNYPYMLSYSNSLHSTPGPSSVGITDTWSFTIDYNNTNIVLKNSSN